jgi:Undecaprenyl-phosphate glucose phosphotransferase
MLPTAMENALQKPLLEDPVTSPGFAVARTASSTLDYAAGPPENVGGGASPTQSKLLMELLGAAVATTDFLLIMATATAAFTVYFRPFAQGLLQPRMYVATALLGAAGFVGGFERLGGYRLKRLQTLPWQVSRIALAWSITTAILLLTAFAGKISSDYSRAWALSWIFIVPLALIAERGFLHGAISRWLEAGLLARKIAVVGAGEEAQKLIAKLHGSDDKSFVITGIFDDRRARRPHSVHGLEVLGTTEDLVRQARREGIDEVIVALPLDAEDRIRAIFEKLAVIPADLRLSVNTLAERLSVRGINYLANVPVLEIIDRPLKNGDAFCKWLEDNVLTILILFLVGPLLVVISLLIKLGSPGPVFFIQERFGFNNNVIRVVKFRTMYVDQGDQSGAQRTLKNDPRVTPIGRVLRSLSLDELPQLFNVLRGEMSLVGPRPHAIAMKAGDCLYHLAVAQYPYRHRVKPGLTGWAQVNGFRGEVNTLEKAHGRIECDLYYIAQWSLWLDLKILLMTVGILISRADAY